MRQAKKKAPKNNRNQKEGQTEQEKMCSKKKKNRTKRTK